MTSESQPDTADLARLLDEYGDACSRLGFGHGCIDFTMSENMKRRDDARAAIEAKVAELEAELDDRDEWVNRCCAHRERIAELTAIVATTRQCATCQLIPGVEGVMHCEECVAGVRAERDAAVAEAERLRNTLTRLREFVADDALAITFQTFGQYRSAILHEIDEGA